VLIGSQLKISYTTQINRKSNLKNYKKTICSLVQSESFHSVDNNHLQPLYGPIKHRNRLERLLNTNKLYNAAMLAAGKTVNFFLFPSLDKVKNIIRIFFLTTGDTYS